MPKSVKLIVNILVGIVLVIAAALLVGLSTFVWIQRRHYRNYDRGDAASIELRYLYLKISAYTFVNGGRYPVLLDEMVNDSSYKSINVENIEYFMPSPNSPTYRSHTGEDSKILVLSRENYAVLLTDGSALFIYASEMPKRR